MSGSEEDYAAAMAAADAVFGVKEAEVVALEEPSNVPTGRILPCLLQTEERSTPPAEKPRKAHRAARVMKASKPEAVKAVVSTPLSEPAKRKASQLPVTTSIGSVAETQRERSSIQDRWVRKTELRPGEKWKRRLRARALGC
ncbi:MAG: hypothetical protein CTY15_13240 [Methylocystis sp.]|nr:MAG: hypothetical protein CTY15_13240 [Methylocystis sp.]